MHVFICLINIRVQLQNSLTLVTIHQLFNQASIVAINKLSIPVSPPDKLIWVLNRKGEFIVKSAYQANMKTSSSTNGSEIWKNL